MKLAKNSVVSNDGYVFNRKTGESFTLNAIAVDLLRLLEDEERDMECLTNYIMENYQKVYACLTTERLKQDFMNVISQVKEIQNETSAGHRM